MRRWLGGMGVAAVVLWGAGCPGSTVEDDPGNGSREGAPCSVDSDCAGLLCTSGVCSTGGGSSSGGSSGGSSGVTSSSSGGTSSSGGMDGGLDVDAHVPAGLMVVDPDGSGSAVEFGATRIGDTVTQNFLVSNLGDAPASIISLGFRNNPSGEFTLMVVGGQPASLAANAQMTLRVTHTATDATADNAFLSIVSNASNPLVEVPITASFKGNPVLVVSDDAVMGAVDITTLQMTPTPVGSPVTAHLYVKNTGQADSALSVTSVALDPAASALFTVSAGTLPRAISAFPGACLDVGGCGPGAAECTNGLCLADSAAGGFPLDVVDIELTFNAANAGEHNIEVVVVANVAGQVQTRRVQIAALAQDSRLVVTPSPIAFGDVFVGRQSQLQVTLENPSDASSVLELTGLGIRFEPSPYAVQLGGVSFPYPLTPGSSVVVTVGFSPTNPGNFGNSLAVSRANGLPIYVPITGAGANEPDANVPAALAFGGVIPGSPRTLPLTIQNQGFGPLAVSMISVTPASAPFSAVPASIASVAAMGSADVMVTYAPAMAGSSDSATLLLQTNDPDQPLIQVNLTGQGVVPQADVTPAAVDFGSVLVGSPAATRIITVRNTGQGTMSVNSPLRVRDAMNTDLTQYVVTASQTLPAGVTSGDSMTLTLAFSPSGTQYFNGSIVITTNDPMRPTFTIPVTGSGNNCAALPNTTVTVVNGTQCSYMCVSNAVSCSDMSCVVCPNRHGATPTCAAGNACQYTCPANTGETSDPGGTCATAQNLGNIQGDKPFFGGGNPLNTSAFRIYPNTDQDWFRFHMVDRLDLLEGIPFATIKATIRLSGVASGEQLGLELRQGSCSGGGNTITVGPGQTGTLETGAVCDTYTTDVNGNTVPVDDGQDYWVRVFPVGDSYQCTSYTLRIDVDEEIFSGFCI